MKKILPVFILLITVNLFSEERHVDIEECINIAFQNHPDIFVSIEDQKKSLADYQLSKATKSVIVNGMVNTYESAKDSKKDATTQLPGEETDIGLFAGINLDYNIFDSKRDYQIDEAKTNIDIAKLKNQKVKNDIIFEVKSSYYNYLLTKNILSIREEMNKKYVKKSELAKQLFEQGSRPILDVSKAELDMGDSQLNYEKAKNDERTQKLNLFNSMGLETTEEISIIPKDVEILPDLKFTPEELFKMAEIYNPVLRMTTLEKRYTRLKISEQNAAHYPSVDISVGFGYLNDNLTGIPGVTDNFETDRWKPTVLFKFIAKMPIYTGGAISSKVDSAETDYNKVCYKEKKLFIEVKNQIRDSYKTLSEIKKQIEIVGLVKKNAQRYHLLAQKSYENGAGSLMELQDAEVSVIKAEIGFLQSKYLYLVNLAKLSGIIGIGENYLCKDRE